MTEMLLEYVRKYEVKKALSALVDGEDPNLQDPDGNTPLHLAVLAQSEVLVKLLIVFDADLTLKNNNKKTALELAEQIVIEGNEAAARNVRDCIREIISLQKRLDDRDRDYPQPSSVPFQKRENLLLSLDGGGIRGLVILQAVLEMEKRRKKRYPNSDPLLSRFNWVTGTSSGGISALALATQKVGAKKGRMLYFSMKDEFLGGMPPFPNEKVDKVFKTVFEDTKMSHLETNASVMTALADQTPPILHIMSSYGKARNKQLPPEETFVWEAARATSAVPFFFHPQDGKYLDGGLIACNPTVDAVIDILEHIKESNNPNLKMVLSFGCGLTKPAPVEDVDFDEHSSFKLGQMAAHALEEHSLHLKEHAQHLEEHAHHLVEHANTPDQKHAEKEKKRAEKEIEQAEKEKKRAEAQDTLAKGASIASLVPHNYKSFANVMKIMIAQISMPDGEVCKRGEFLCKAVGAQYFRINPDLSETVEFNTTDDAELINMLYDVVHYMLENCVEQTDPVLDFIYGGKLD